MVQLKDVVTLGNLLCGAAAVVFCIRGDTNLAAWSILLAYGFDALDGPVARLTGGANRFGAELDNLADYFTFGIAPGFVVYQAVSQQVPQFGVYVGVVCGGALIVYSTLRHVRNLVFDAPTTLCWVGLPRPAAGLIVASLVQSRLFAWQPLWSAAVLIPALAWALLATFPTINHRGRRLQSWVRAFGWAALIGSAAFLIIFRDYFWDWALHLVIAYACFSWVALTRGERKQYFDDITRWKAKLVAGG